MELRGSSLSRACLEHGGRHFQVTDFGKGPELHDASDTFKALEKVRCFLNKTRHGGGLPDELNAYAQMKAAQKHGSFPTGLQRPGHWRPDSACDWCEEHHPPQQLEPNHGDVGFGLTIERIQPMR